MRIYCLIRMAICNISWPTSGGVNLQADSPFFTMNRAPKATERIERRLQQQLVVITYALMCLIRPARLHKLIDIANLPFWMLPVPAGVGNRGSSAVSRLVQNGKLSGAEMWCLDHDRKLLDTVGNANTVVVRKEEPHMVPLPTVTALWSDMCSRVWHSLP